MLLFWGGVQVGIAQEVRLTKQEKADMLLLAEEEKLARDVYRSFEGLYDLPIFSNIARSEQHHLEMMTELAETFEIGLPAPLIMDEEGIFANRQLQKLYDRWTKEGQSSLAAALEVGALFEETDIRDLTTAISNTDREEVRSVYERLRKASGNHLRAYTKQLKNRGVDYQPTVLEPAEFEQILGEKQGKGGEGKCKKGAGCCKKAE